MEMTDEDMDEIVDEIDNILRLIERRANIKIIGNCHGWHIYLNENIAPATERAIDSLIDAKHALLTNAKQ